MLLPKPPPSTAYRDQPDVTHSLLGRGAAMLTAGGIAASALSGHMPGINLSSLGIQ